MKSDLNLFKALGEKTKHNILKALLKKELCACRIPVIIKSAQPNTSMQLAKLLKWGLISQRREGKKIIYSLKDKRVSSVFSLLDQRKRI